MFAPVRDGLRKEIMSENVETVRKIRVKWVRSSNGAKLPHKRTIKALGLRRLQGEVIKEATPAILGMVQSVRHLVEVTEVSES